MVTEAETVTEESPRGLITRTKTTLRHVPADPTVNDGENRATWRSGLYLDMKDEDFKDPKSADATNEFILETGLFEKGLPAISFGNGKGVVHCIAPESDGASDDTLCQQ